ncbi:hypothetical protein [Rhodococcus aetherivorans]|uniref:hypothetical protein n=1 Tax=Rhodococcus aetherivorans TaxID=191292 RepID=UPI00241C2C91|nr:hypothetical protein [Rhodococcus aetherivorans]WFS15178.1 hypothetical protein P9K37_09100 [Rhodococcus aetherivorans]
MAGISRAERERREALLAEGLKECTGPRGCGEVKPLEEFRERADGFAGRRAECIGCEQVAEAAWRAEHRAEETARVRRYWAAQRFGQRLSSGAVRARQAGVPVEDVTPEALLADWERRGIDPERDVYTGEQLREGWHLDHAWPLSAPGTPGHIVGNIVPCNRETNTTKHRRGWVDFLADRAEAEGTAQHPAVGRYVTAWEPTEADKETAA